MTNYEKYKDEIIEELTECSCNFIRNLMGEGRACWDKSCEECERRLVNWLNAEYTEEIDWDKVKQGTKVYCYGEAKGKFVAVYDSMIVVDTEVGWDIPELKVVAKDRCRLEK